jgi:hypothetical protein
MVGANKKRDLLQSLLQPTNLYLKNITDKKFISNKKDHNGKQGSKKEYDVLNHRRVIKRRWIHFII